MDRKEMIKKLYFEDLNDDVQTRDLTCEMEGLTTISVDAVIAEYMERGFSFDEAYKILHLRLLDVIGTMLIHK